MSDGVEPPPHAATARATTATRADGPGRATRASSSPASARRGRSAPDEERGTPSFGVLLSFGSAPIWERSQKTAGLPSVNGWRYYDQVTKRPTASSEDARCRIPCWTTTCAARCARRSIGSSTARGPPPRTGKFWWLDDDCRVDRSHGQQLWITARMTHVFSLGHLLGRAGDASSSTSGLASLDRDFGDTRARRLVPAARRRRPGRRRPRRPTSTPSCCWPHRAPRSPGDRAQRTCSPGRPTSSYDRFWDDDAGALVESWDSAWQAVRGLSRGQRQHARGRGVPRSGRRDRRRPLAAARDAHRRPGDQRRRPVP